MANNKRPPGTEAPFQDLSETMRGSAQQIWLAGLGAFTKAQAEGSKAFDSLVKEGIATQRNNASGTEEKLRETAERMASMAGEMGSRAAAPWGRLEGIFEERVARAIEKLGIPAATDLAELSERLDAIEARLDATTSAKATAKRAPRKTPDKPVPKAAIKTPGKAARPRS